MFWTFGETLQLGTDIHSFLPRENSFPNHCGNATKYDPKNYLWKIISAFKASEYICVGTFVIPKTIIK